MKKITNVIAFPLFVFAVISGGCGGSGSGPSTSGPVVSKDNTSINVKGVGGSLLGHGTELATGFSGLSLDNVYIVDDNDRSIQNMKITPLFLTHQKMK